MVSIYIAIFSSISRLPDTFTFKNLSTDFIKSIFIFLLLLFFLVILQLIEISQQTSLKFINISLIRIIIIEELTS